MSFRILIADDEPQIRHLIRKLVEKHEGWDVCGEASDGLEAIEKAAALEPDLILLDISMPKLDGLSAAPRIMEASPQSAILILTLHQSLDMARMASSAGAVAYVAKSLASRELVPAIEAYEAVATASH
jgi:two-component system, response regulator PdtaR